MSAETVRLLDRDQVAGVEDRHLTRIGNLGRDRLLGRFWAVTVFASPEKERRAGRSEVGRKGRFDNRPANTLPRRRRPLERFTRFQHAVTGGIVKQMLHRARSPPPGITELSGFDS